MNAPAEGALLLFLFVLSGALEDLAMARTTRAVEALHALMPTGALRWNPGQSGAGQANPTHDIGGTWVTVSPDELVPGDIVKVLPGESIPTDCELLDAHGSAAVDQANLTGESMPRVAMPGDELYAGTINVGNPLTARVRRVARESSLQRVLNLVISAQQQREPVQRIIDRVSQPYAISVVACSVAVLLIWWLLLDLPLISADGGVSANSALATAITLLVVMSPCAVIIATPTATLAAIARAARSGVLFKGGQAIERLSRLGALALDKTGTLTVGRPRVTKIIPIDGADPRELLACAAGIEQDSTHPIATAIKDAAKSPEHRVAPRAATHSEFVHGRGVSGVIDAAPVRLGTLTHVGEIVSPRLRDELERHLRAEQSLGNIAVAIAVGKSGGDGAHAGVIVIADTARRGADTIVARLRDLGVDPVMMLTGDNQATAQVVAGNLGFSRWHAQMLPEHKVEHIAQLKSEITSARRHATRTAVGVIGDGVNDAPALAAADVSIAIGSIGSDAAMESADIVLLADDLAAVPWAVSLARKARRTILINLTFALSAIACMACATLVGSLLDRQVPLWLGVIGHEGGTLLVVLNSLMLLAVRGWYENKKI